MKILIALLTIIIILGLGLTSLAQQIDARGAGMAFSNSADTRGLEQVGMNPATLALNHRYNFEFNFLSFNISAFNNSLSKGTYDQFFTGGDSLLQKDKASLLSGVPSSGIKGNISAQVNTFAVYMPHFSLAVVGMGNGYFSLPKEIAELALYGNSDFGRTYDFSNLDGQGWGGGAVMMGLAFSLPFLKSSTIREASFGITAKYLTGLRYFEVISSSGKLYNLDYDNPFLRLDGLLEARTAEGGTGFGYDMGFLFQSQNNFTISLALLNAYSNVNWTNNPKHIFYSIQSENFTVSSDGIDDSLIVKEDTSFSVVSFTTQLPRVLDIGFAYQVAKPLLFTGEFQQGLNSNMGTLKSTRFAMGMEYTGIPLLPIRTGISNKTGQGFSFAFGLGLNLHFWYMDLAYINHGGLSSKSASGATIAATTRIRF